MRDHVRILGILNIVMGALTALIGIVVFVILGGAAGMLSAGVAGDLDTAHVPAPLIAGIGFGVGVFFLILAAPSIIGGWGLLNFRPWARILIIIVSILHLLNFPFGTALGVYGLWALLSEQGRRLFEGPSPGYFQPGNPARSAPPPPVGYPPQPPPGA